MIILLSYNSQTKSKVKNVRVKSPTNANTDHHNGDLQFVILLVTWQCSEPVIISETKPYSVTTQIGFGLTVSTQP